MTILTTGPLTNMANFLLSNTNSTSKIEHVYIVGGGFDDGDNVQQGNLFTFPSNKNAEFHMFLDPYAAKQVIATTLNITLIPLNVQRKASSFDKLIKGLDMSKETPEAVFMHRLLTTMEHLYRSHHVYNHLDMFLGEVLGAVIMIDRPELRSKTKLIPVRVMATGDAATDGWTIVDHEKGNPLNILEEIDTASYYRDIVATLNEKVQSAVVANFSEQKQSWTHP